MQTDTHDGVFAPHNSPITISSGSPLRIQTDDGWTQIDARTIVTQSPEGQVSKVTVVDPGGTHPLVGSSTGSQYDITFEFPPATGSLHLKLGVQTNPEGRNVRVVTRCDASFGKHFFHNDTTYQSLDDTAITNLEVRIDGALKYATARASLITIDYSAPAVALLRRRPREYW